MNQSCSIYEPCNESTGLLCQEGVCVCRNNSFWNGKNCSNYSVVEGKKLIKKQNIEIFVAFIFKSPIESV